MARASYVYKACLNCRKHKTKCTGRSPCEQCCLKSLECTYPSGPPRRKATQRTKTAMSEEGLAVGMRSHASPAVKQRDGKTDSRRTPIAKSQAPDARNTTANRGVMSFAFDCFGCGDSIVLSPGSNAWTCPSSLPTHTCRETHATPIPEVKQDRSVFGAGPRIDGWDIQSKLIEVQFMRRMVETYLAKVNPFLPCLNVTRMRSDVEAMLAGKLPRKESRQVGAAADLMTAVMMAMTEDAACITRPGWIPGWTEYDRAERLLRDGSHSDRETLGTVQCFILKALYLICIDKFNLAYDTMGTVARLCYQLELHDEKRWRNQSSFEIHLRQRILWTAFFLDSHISQYCNAPYLLRFSDVDVPIPRHIDDKKLQPDSDLLPEEDSNAPIVNLDTCSQYARLYSEIWDRVLTVNASRRCSPETAAAIERQIKDLRRGLPVHLQWNQYDSSRLSAERSSHFHVRQSMLLHLQINNLHLLLKDRCMETGGMDDGTVDAYTETAIDSIQIIWEYYQANLHDPIERTGSTRYLIQSIQALNCMVLRRSETGGTMHPMAVEALSRGLSVLETFAPHLTLAKMALDQLEIPIQEFMGLSCKPTPGHLAEKSFACEEDMTASCVPHGLYEYHAAETSVGDEDWVGDIVDTSTIHSTCNSDNWLYDFLNE